MKIALATLVVICLSPSLALAGANELSPAADAPVREPAPAPPSLAGTLLARQATLDGRLSLASGMQVGGYTVFGVGGLVSVVSILWGLVAQGRTSSDMLTTGYATGAVATAGLVTAIVGSVVGTSARKERDVVSLQLLQEERRLAALAAPTAVAVVPPPPPMHLLPPQL